MATDQWDYYTGHLGLRLSTLRERRGVSQEKLAASAGITTFTYRLLEGGPRKSGRVVNPRLRTLVGLALALECEVADLLPPKVAHYRPR